MTINDIYNLLKKALARGASDVIFSSNTKPVLKLHNKMQEQEEFSVVTSEEIIHFLAELSHHSLTEVLKSHKDFDFAIQVEGIARFRVNVLHTMNGVGAVLRPIKETIPTFEELHVPMEQYINFASYPNGLVLFTGATGSGKSSSLASVLEYINQHQEKHIITIEDPIEFIYENKKSVFQQREIPAHSKSFYHALRASLREASDVVLLGEMRDLETMGMALTAAETGALVFSTLHTAGSTGAIDRVIDAFPADKQHQIRIQLSQVLRAVVWQVLLPRKDGNGVVPAIEVLYNNHAIAHLIRKGQTHQMPSVLETSKKEGMIPMRHAILDLLDKDLITDETAEEYIESIRDLEKKED